MEERLQKLLSSAGICSRRKAEEYIIAGRVKVNGKTATLGDKADIEKDQVTVNDCPVQPQKKTIWLMLNKPRGYVTTLEDEKGRRTTAQLVENCNLRVWPVGRLDMDSEGLLLFTNDGEGTHRLLHPSHEVEKEYEVTVEGDVDRALPLLRGSMELDGRRLAPAKVRLLQTEKPAEERLSVVIHEGKNRQVRRMCAMAGLKVKRLKRIREGSLWLGDLPVGAWRRLDKTEIEGLLR